MEQTKQKLKNVWKALKDEFGYSNVFSAPRLEKVIISVGTGSKVKNDKNYNTFVIDRIAKITGQKPALRSSKKSIASFKIRQGDPIGVMVTLRGASMNSFVDKLIHVALPRTKDFRGLKKSGIDQMGNLTIGIKEHSIFPEVGDEELKNVFSFAITFVTTAKNKQEALKFFEYLGFPFKKD
jgi:large subunit ribosomal protein L5